MSDPHCHLCGTDLSPLCDSDQLEHLNACLDAKLSELPPFPSPAASPKPAPPTFDQSEMPNYLEMSKSQVQTELEKFGMKKTISLPQAKAMLEEIWLYQRYRVWPKFMDALA